MQKFPNGSKVRLVNSMEDFGIIVTGVVVEYIPAHDGFDFDGDQYQMPALYLVQPDQDTGEFGFTGECYEEDIEAI